MKGTTNNRFPIIKFIVWYPGGSELPLRGVLSETCHKPKKKQTSGAAAPCCF